MTQFVNNDVSSGAIVYASDHNTQGALIAGVLNGKIDDANINSSAAISGSKLADTSIPSSKLSAGMVAQIVGTGFSAVATGATTIPLDDTIPQNTEGTEFMTQSITPKSTTNILLIEIVAMLSTSTAKTAIGALFQDSTANALAAVSAYIDTGTGMRMVSLMYSMAAGTTSSTTFKFRAGPDAAATMTFNGSSGSRLYGAISKSYIKITEYRA